MGTIRATDKLIYECNNNSIELCHCANYMIADFKEFTTNNIYNIKASGQNGATYISSNLDNKEINIVGYINMRIPNYELLERKLKQAFTPHQVGKLIFKGLGYEKEIFAIPTSIIEFERIAGLGHCRFEINLESQGSPYWQGREIAEIFSEIRPTLKFQINSNDKKPIIMGVKKNVLTSIINNIGDVETGFRAIFRCRDGTSKNPEIINKETGQKIRIIANMEKNDMIEIFSFRNKKMIFYNGIDSFTKIDRKNSDWFYLPTGGSQITYRADENFSNLDFTIYYNPLYL